MLEVTTLEFFFRAIPEAFLFVFATYTFSKAAIDKRRYLFSSILLAIIGFSVRQLPINYGVHTILAIIALIALNVCINKFKVIKAIQVVNLTFILELVCEGLNILFIQYVLGVDINNISRNITTKMIYLSPSLIVFSVIVFSYYYILLKRKKLKDI